MIHVDIVKIDHVGGNCCFHPYAEGFVIMVENEFVVIDDCKRGLHNQYIEDDMSDEHRKETLKIFTEVANEIQEKISIINEQPNNKINFDFSRIEELKEGWWPVIWAGSLDSCHERKIFNGYLVTGNCD